MTGYAAIKLAMYLIPCISTNLSPPQRLPLGIPIMNNNNNNNNNSNNNDDDDDDDGGGGGGGGGGDDEDDVNNARWTMGRGKGRERGLTSFSLSPSHRTQRAFVFLPPQPPDDTKGSFSNDEGDDSENVTFKMNKRFSNFVVFIPIH